ncbi:leucyl aminopeptidase [Alphaproteobacteria bacterium]|nr:leucyl aminopeptidase [Alphaproteobacteria bacterium]
MNISFDKFSLPSGGALGVLIEKDLELGKSGKAINEAMGGGLKAAIEASGFEGKEGKTLVVVAPAELEVSHLVLIGIGKGKKAGETAFINAGGEAVKALENAGIASLAIELDGADSDKNAARLAFGAQLRTYYFDKYKTREKDSEKPARPDVVIMTKDPKDARKEFSDMEGIASGVFMTRDLVSEPANILYPETLADRAAELADLGVKITTLGQTEMEKLGFGALLGVAQGSAREPKLVIMEWKGSDKGDNERPVAFVGKGVTFDTGGISIKPAAGMEDMKWDMGGSGVVIGLMKALAARKAKVNAIGVVGLVENMPSSTAQRPGDIVTSYSGQTIEVLNTDAEGRLVLADALWYTEEQFSPRLMVDLATLTGAVIVSLGMENAGLFSNDDKLSQQLTAAGLDVEEPVWRMPMGEVYNKQLASPAADMANISPGRWGGSITAACFLERFVQEGTPWAHLDIAGVTWSDKDKSTKRKGATGFGVRLLDRFVADNCES